MASKEPRRNVQRGILGDGNGNVRLTDRPDYVYCRIKSEANAVWQVLNHKVADVEHLPVLIEKMHTGNDWQVIDVDIPMLANVDDGWEGEPYLPAHAATHEWADGNPGMDSVDVHPRALTPLRCYPKSTTELKVRFAPLRYTYGGEFKSFPGGELDLSSYQPASGQARYVLTYLDPRDNLPYAVFGGIEADVTPLTPPTPDIPPYAVLSSLVRVDGDQTYFPESDFVDHRDLLNVLTPDKIDDLADVEIHDLADDQVLTYDNASGQWVNANQSGGGVTDAEYLVLTLDASLTDERRLVDGVGLTGADGGAGGDYTVDLDIDSLDAEATADDADTIAIHDDSAGAVKKQTRANLLSGKAPDDAQYLVLAVGGDLSDERRLVDGVGLAGADGGAGDDYTLRLDINGMISETTPDNADSIAIHDTSSGYHRKQTRYHFLKAGLELSGSGVVDLNGCDDALVLDADADTTISALTDDQIDFEVGGSDVATLIAGGFSADTFAFTAKNTSGDTASANDVGYIDEAGEYKTTTTAYDAVSWCVVLIGGANNADIFVARRGRVLIALNGNCSAGDYLYTSTTAGQAQPLSYVRSEVFAVALTANAGGAGGTCEALLLCNRAYRATMVSPSYFVFAHSDFDFVATIASLPGGADLTYNAPSSGNEDTIAPYSTTYNYKLVLHNTTRGDSALVDSVIVATNTITLTANVPGTWQVGDTITARSQTATGTAGTTSYYYEIDVNDSVNALATVLVLSCEKLDSGAAGDIMILGTFEATPKNEVLRIQVASAAVYNGLKMHTPINNSIFVMASTASGSGTSGSIIRQSGYFVAAP